MAFEVQKAWGFARRPIWNPNSIRIQSIMFRRKFRRSLLESLRKLLDILQ